MEFGWPLRSANGQIIAIGGEGFGTKEGAKTGIAAGQEGLRWS